MTTPLVSRSLAIPMSDDGAGPALTCLVYLPPRVGSGGARPPAVVCCHGLGEDGLRVAPLARRLAEAGVVAVCPTLRGSAPGPGQGGTASMTSMSVLTQVADVTAVLDELGRLPLVDSSRLGLMGRSQGGLVAALTAARRPGGLSALVLWYPALGAPQALRSQFRSPSGVPATFTRTVDGRTLTLGARYALDAWNLDVPAELRRLRTPTLLVHGDADRDVPLSTSRQALAAVSDGRLHVVAGAGHGFDGEYFDQAAGVTQEFLEWNGLCQED